MSRCNLQIFPYYFLFFSVFFPLEIIAKLNELPGQFEPIIAQIDGNLGPVHDMFGKQLASFRTFTPHITSYGKYGDISVIVIATFVLLVAILMLLGSTIGLWKFDRAVPPTQRKGAVTCGNFCLILYVFVISTGGVLKYLKIDDVLILAR